MVGKPFVDKVLRFQIDLLSNSRHVGERSRFDVGGSECISVLVILVGASEVIDIRLGYVGAERTLRVLECDRDRAVVGSLDEVGVL